MSVKIDVEVPEWLVDALAGDPETDLWVAFRPQPELFSRVVKLGPGGVEYAGSGGPTCAQELDDVVAYRIGPDGETVAVGGVTVELVGEELVEVESETEADVKPAKGKKPEPKPKGKK